MQGIRNGARLSSDIEISLTESRNFTSDELCHQSLQNEESSVHNSNGRYISRQMRYEEIRRVNQKVKSTRNLTVKFNFSCDQRHIVVLLADTQQENFTSRP